MQVSDRINCGVYVFTPEIFTAIQDVSSQRKDRGMQYGVWPVGCWCVINLEIPEFCGSFVKTT
jgi:hypothetical protein